MSDSNFELYLMQRHREQCLEGSWLEKCIITGIASALIGAGAAVGITYAVMKNNEKKNEDSPETVATVQVESNNYALDYSSKIENKENSTYYFKNERVL